MNYKMEVFAKENRWCEPEQNWAEIHFTLRQLKKLFPTPNPEILKDLLARGCSLTQHSRPTRFHTTQEGERANLPIVKQAILDQITIR